MRRRTADGRRLLFITTSLGLGGADRQVIDLARAFKRLAWAVGIISLIPPDPWPDNLVDEGIKVATLAMRPGIPDPRRVLALARQIRLWKPDVVHSHMVHANLLARVTRLAAPVPVLISTIHNANEGPQWRYVASRLTYRLSDVTTAVSQAAIDEAVRRGAAPAGGLRLVHNGVALDTFDADAAARDAMRRSLSLADEFVWLAAGRLVPAKGYPDLLEAFRHVHAESPSSTLLIAGTGPQQADIEGLIGAAGLTDSVRLLGPRDDMPALMQAADALVLSSIWEGLPMVLLEAAAASLPIVATDVGGNREAVVHESTGLLTRPRDPVALRNAMCEVMAMSPEARRAMGAAGRRHVTRTFDLEHVVATWEALYVERLALAMRGSRYKPAA